MATDFQNKERVKWYKGEMVTDGEIETSTLMLK